MARCVMEGRLPRWCCGSDSQGRPISTLDEYELGPLAKFRRFGLVPWRLLAMIALLLVSTGQVVLFSNVHGNGQRAVGVEFGRTLFPPNAYDLSGNSADFPSMRVIVYSAPVVISTLEYVSERYFNLSRLATQPTAVGGDDVVEEVCYNGEGERGIPTVTLVRYKARAEEIGDPNADWGGEKETLEWEVHEPKDILLWSKVDGRGSVASRASDFVRRLISMRITLPLTTMDPIPDEQFFGTHSCFRWNGVVQVAHVVGGSQVEMRADAFMRDECSSASEHPSRVDDLHLVVTWIMLVLMVVFEIASIYDTVRAFQLVLQLRGQEDLNETGPRRRPAAMLHSDRVANLSGTETPRQIWASLSCSDRLQLFRPWFFLATAGNVLGVVYCITQLAGGQAIASGAVPRSILGASTAFLWLSSLQYAEYDVRTNALVLTLTHSLPRIGTLLVGVLPLFAAFVVIGLSLFGTTVPRYGSPLDTAITLFAIINGDAVRETITRCVSQLGPGTQVWYTVFGQMYSFIGIILFTFVGLHCLIAIAEEAFFASRPDGLVDVQSRGGRRLPVMLRALLDRISRESIARQNLAPKDTTQQPQEEQPHTHRNEWFFAACCRS